jgi:zinc protease
MSVVMRSVAVAAVIACVRVVSPWNLNAQPAPAPPRPSVGTLTPAPALAPVQTTLANGVRLVTLTHGRTPKALLQVVVETGGEQADQCQLTQVLAEIFRSGTESLSGAALTDSIAHMGGELAISVRPEGIELTLEVLSPYSAPAIELLGHIVRNPRLDSVTTTAADQAVAERGPGARSEISTAAEDAFRTALFPAGEFGRSCAATGHTTAYTPADVRRFYTARATGRHTTVYVVGQFNRVTAAGAVARAFGGLPHGEAASARTTAAAPAPSLQIVQRPGAKQFALMVGERVPGPGDSDYTRLRVADALLGGSLISRITVNIREAHGYAYSPASDLVATPSGEAYWAEATNVAAPVAWPALREIIKEVARLGVDAPPDSELLGTQRYVIGRTLVTRATRAGALDALEAADAGANGSDDADRLLGVTPGEVRRVVRSYIAPRDLTIVLAGDTTAMGGQIADLRRGVAALRAGQPEGAR